MTDLSPFYVENDDGCWIWHEIKKNGYGQWAGGLAHKIVWELFNGPVPQGLHLDHLCRVRSCVNPTHMEPVTIKENVLRGESPTAINARKTKCSKGHDLFGTNLRIYGGKRQCGECHRDRSARHRMKADNASD